MVRRVGLAHPRTEVNLIDADRLIVRGLGLSVRHPFCIVPAVSHVPGYGGRLRWDLAREGEWVGLLRCEATRRCHVILVTRPRFHIRNKGSPDAGGADGMQPMGTAIPAVEITDNADIVCIGCPDGEVKTRRAIHHGRVRAELLIKAEVASLVEEVHVLRAKPTILTRHGWWRCGRRIGSERQELRRLSGVAHGIPGCATRWEIRKKYRIRG